MEMEGKNTSQHLYITHPAARRNDVDFAYLARQLRAAGLAATYDRIELSPGDDLWSRISEQVGSADTAGWAYVITSRCLTDRFCRDQLLCALDRACEERGAGFPLVALLHGIAAQNLPPALKLRPCVHLADPQWKERIKTFLGRHGAEDGAQFLWRIHPSYGGDASKTAIEVAPRTESVRFWRFAVPAAIPPVHWGHGPSGGGAISPLRFTVVKGAGKLKNTEIVWFGSEDCLSQAESAYAVFHGRLPEFICFGRARNPSGPPLQMEMFHTGLNRQ